MCIRDRTHVATEIEFEAPLNEEELLAVFEKSGVQGFPAELDIACLLYTSHARSARRRSCPRRFRRRAGRP